MKKIVLYLSMIAAPAFAQNPSVQWEKNVNGALSGYDVVNSSWKDPNGNFLMVGTSSGDAYVLKVDNNGNQLAHVVYDGPQSGYDNGYVVKGDAAGNIYIGGITAYSSKNLPFIAKYNSTGIKVWEYVQSSAAIDGTITAITLDNYTNPANVYFTGSKNDSSAITRINANTGSAIWEKTLWPHGKMNDIDVDNNGHPLVCGYQAFSGVNADFYAAVLDIPTGYPLRGFWNDGAATDSVTDPSGHFDQAYKIKSGPAGTFVVFGTMYNNPTGATMYMAKFGSTGNVPAWTYNYNSPNHTEGKGIELFVDAAFSNFYYLSQAMSSTGTYYGYTIAGKVNNSGTAVWEKEFNVSMSTLDPRGMTVDGNGNMHLIADEGYPGDIHYMKLASANGSTMGAMVYDNMRGGGNAYDYSSGIFLDNTSHPYITGHSNALTYTNLDVLLVKLNTNATLDWDLTYDFFINAQDFAFNVQVGLMGGSEEIVTCGQVSNNITNGDVALTSYSETGNVNWQVIFDDNNGGDQACGFERSYSNNFFLCSYNNSNSQTTITEFYNDGTTNFSNKPTWNFQPNCYKLDTAENSFAVGTAGSMQDFNLGIYLRTGVTVSVPTATISSWTTVGNSIATDNASIYVGGTIFDFNSGGEGMHPFIQKFDMNGNVLWSAKIMGFDSTNYSSNTAKIFYDRTSNSVYYVSYLLKVGSSVSSLVLSRIDAATGNVLWVRNENMSDTRNERFSDIVVSNGKIYITGFAFMASSNDNMSITEAWDINGNKQWEYVFDKAGIIDESSHLLLDNAGNIFVSGKTNAPIFYSGSDALLMKLDPAGNLLWKSEYNGIGNGDDLAVGIALSGNFPNNQRIYMVANVQSTNGYYYDIGTLKFCDLPSATITHGATSICQNASTTLAASGVSSGNVTWSNGNSSSAIVANNSGDYSFTYTESDGCAINSDTVHINIKGAPTAVQICMVTVDDSSKHNLILWDKTAATPDVIGFNIYREDLTNIYHQIGSVSYSSLSEYVDLDANANPNSTTKRYKITTVDSCGNESPMSNYHNTIYIVSSGGGQFSWNQLYTIEGSANPVVQYILLRDDYSTNNWHAVDSTAGTQFNINDVNFGVFQPTASWRVVTQWGISCTPTAKQGGNSTQAAIIKSKSNISNNRITGVDQTNSNMIVGAYPNPAQNNLTVTVPQAAKTNIKLRNLIGEEVLIAELQNENTTQLDMSKLTSGVYMLEVNSAAGKFIKRIVKE